MKVLITGATGFVGQAMVRYLLDQGLDVAVFARPGRIKSELADKVEVRTGDITDLNSVTAAAVGCDSIFHLAGHVGYSVTDRRLMENVNVFGTANVIHAARAQNVRRLLHFSSVVAIGAGLEKDQILNEDSEYNLGAFDLGYFETKRKAEKLVKDCVAAGQIDAVIVNPSTIYGPGDAEKGSRKTQIKVAQGKMPFFTIGGVSVVDVDSVVKATFQAWKSGLAGRRYILSGENLTICELFHHIAEIAGVKAPSILMPKTAALALGKIGDLLEHFGQKGPLNSESARVATMFHWFDNSRAKKELGLSPKPAREALQDSVYWMNRHGLLTRT